MSEWYREARQHWPALEVPESVIAYFIEIRLFNRRNKLFLSSRDNLLSTVQRGRCFAKFWEHILQTHPEKEEYFATLLDDTEPFKPYWARREYYRYLYGKEFNELHDDEQKALEDEFRALRRRAYQAALQGEANRLNCDLSEVRPSCPVLELGPNANQESKLADLPDTILLKIMNQLDTLDIFKVTLVCKRWKNLIYNYPRELRRAEYARTTHILTFSDPEDPSKPLCNSGFEQDYEIVRRGLINWYCRISENLETLIMGDPDSCSNLAALLRSCPNLKNLQIGYEDESFALEDDECTFEDVDLPNLEFYYSELNGCGFQFIPLVSHLLSCESLRYFGANLGIYQFSDMHTRDRMQHAFGRLVALDLVTYSIEILDILAKVDDLQLMYFRLGDRDASITQNNHHLQLTREADVLCRIIGKLRKLEIFISVRMPLVSNNIIERLTSMKSNLKLAAFAEYSSFNDRNEVDEWEPNVLVEFGKMLLSNDPGLDMAQFCFVVKEDSVPQKFIEMNTGFTFLDTRDVCNIRVYDIPLNDLSIKRKSGINF